VLPFWLERKFRLSGITVLRYATTTIPLEEWVGHISLPGGCCGTTGCMPQCGFGDFHAVPPVPSESRPSNVEADRDDMRSSRPLPDSSPLFFTASSPITQRSQAVRLCGLPQPSGRRIWPQCWGAEAIVPRLMASRA